MAMVTALHGSIYLGNTVGQNTLEQNTFYRNTLDDHIRGKPVWTLLNRSAMVLGPTRSGKSSSIVVPSILTTPGPVLSTSTKDDILRSTYPIRKQFGRCYLYDPSGTVPVPDGMMPLKWSPLLGAADWNTACITATAMRETARLTLPGASMDTTANELHWHERSAALLATLIHAAAINGSTMADVVEWVDTRNCIPALDIIEHAIKDNSARSLSSQVEPDIGLTLEKLDNKIAHDLLVGIAGTDQRELSGIWSTTSGALSAYRSATALVTTMGDNDTFFDSNQFIQSPDTIYICASGVNQSAYAPLIVGLISSIQTAKYSQNTTLQHKGITSPDNMQILFALDEIANIAPLPQLQSLVSEGTGQGIITLACLQDMSQARTRWGTAASGFLSLFGYTVILPGIKDIETLNALETLAGKQPTIEQSVSMPIPSSTFHQIKSRLLFRSPPPNTPTITTSTSIQPVLPADAISRGKPGHALVVDEHSRFNVVKLTSYYDHEPFKSAILHTERSTGLETAHNQELGLLHATNHHTKSQDHQHGIENKGLSALDINEISHEL